MSSTGEETATAARAATGGLPDILIRAGPRLGAPPRPPPIGPRPPASFHSEAPESVLPLPPYPVSFCMSASDMSFLSLYTYYAPARPLKIAANATPVPARSCIVPTRVCGCAPWLLSRSEQASPHISPLPPALPSLLFGPVRAVYSTLDDLALRTVVIPGTFGRHMHVLPHRARRDMRFIPSVQTNAKLLNLPSALAAPSSMIACLMTLRSLGALPASKRPCYPGARAERPHIPHVSFCRRPPTAAHVQKTPTSPAFWHPQSHCSPMSSACVQPQLRLRLPWRPLTSSGPER